MPADTNPSGDIFGGWVLAQMDLAAGIVAAQRARGRVATAALDGMSFHRPVYVGDLVSCYAKVVRIGRSSMTVQVDTFVLRRRRRRGQGDRRPLHAGRDRRAGPASPGAAGARLRQGLSRAAGGSSSTIIGKAEQQRDPEHLDEKGTAAHP